MLNLRSDVPIKAEVLEEVRVRFAQIRDLQNEAEQLLHMAIVEDKDVFMTREEVAELFKCPANRVPRVIPRIRIGKNWLFKKGDVNAFIEERIKAKA